MNVITRGIRNAFRNATRTISIVAILGLSIGLSLTMLIAHQAVNDKINSVKSSIGNTVSITPAGFQGMMGGGDPLTTDQLKKVASIAHVTKVSESITDQLTSSNSSLTSAIDAGSLGKRFGGGEGLVIMGEKGDETPPAPPIMASGSTDTAKVNNSTITLSSGSQIDGSKDTPSALVGKTLAEKNNLKVGSTFTAYNTTITVAGIYDSGTRFANNGVIFSLPTLQRLSSQSGKVTSATAYIDSISNIDAATSKIKSALGSSADVTNGKEAATNAVEPLQSISKVSLFSLIGAVIAGGVIILLTMIMIVRERQREIGVLKAIGGSNLRIMGQFAAESLTLTILGAVIGLVIGVIGGQPVTKMLVTNGVSNTSSSSQMGGPAISQSGGPSTAQSSSSSAVEGTPVVRRIGGPLGRNSTVRGIQNVQAEIGWSIILYGIGAASVIALLGSSLAAAMIAKVRPSQVMRTE